MRSSYALPLCEQVSWLRTYQQIHEKHGLEKGRRCRTMRLTSDWTIITLRLKRWWLDGDESVEVVRWCVHSSGRTILSESKA